MSLFNPLDANYSYYEVMSMEALGLARFQFASTTTYHFFFVPLTLGLSILVALLETAYVRTGDERYRKLARFYGHLFMINFALGVVTGLVQEFQFGMNWSGYARFMGDIFGVPLAIEALLAFFLESTFLGLWFFTWEKVPKGLHALFIWLVAIGSNLSALWILIANSFMQHPVGYRLEQGRALLASFPAIFLNPHVWLQFPHTLFAALATAGFFVAAVAAWHLLRDHRTELFLPALRLGLASALAGSLLVIVIGHFQADFIVRHQPMKFAAMEAIWDDLPEPAPWTLAAAIDEKAMRNTFEIRLPGVLSLLAHAPAREDGKRVFPGIKSLDRRYQKTYGPGRYVPPVKLTYWSFRIMVFSGLLMLLLSAWGVVLWARRRLAAARGFLAALLWAVLLPYLANTTGWWTAEFGRQPWMVQGLLTIEQGLTPTSVVPASLVWLSAVGFTLLYLVLGVIDVWLLVRFAKADPDAEAEAAPAY